MHPGLSNQNTATGSENNAAGDVSTGGGGTTISNKTGGDAYSFMLVQCNHYVCGTCASLYKGNKTTST